MAQVSHRFPHVDGVVAAAALLAVGKADGLCAESLEQVLHDGGAVCVIYAYASRAEKQAPVVESHLEAL